jgi:excinuclease ABC subunit B
MDFRLHSPFQPTGDQPQAINLLTNGLNNGLAHQVLLGVTGSGKTFTMASVIAKMQRPTLVISHNKTLAAQLYQEFRDFFPENAVSYFVSYYDFYQPEAYIPQTDTYIEKETEINEEIDKLRLSATTDLLTRRDTIIIASVSCIYNIGSPKEYGQFVLELKKGVSVSREQVLKRLVNLQYNKTSFDFKRSTFRVRGDRIDIFPAYEDTAIRFVFDNEKIVELTRIDPLNGETIEDLEATVIYPAKHYMTDPAKWDSAFSQIRDDLSKRVKQLRSQGKILEAHRLQQRVNYDLEMIAEVGYVNGIENYSRYFDGRAAGDPPYTLLDYFSEPYGKDWLLFVDESHMTVPQIRGMYNGDRSRKQTLIDFGFRLPAALDNRPLMFLEFEKRVPQTIYVSATPDHWEISLAKEYARQLEIKNHNGVVEQLIRPTGILDPEIIIRPTQGQIIDLVTEILVRKKRKERVLVTTITKRMAEDLSDYLNEKKYLSDPRFKDRQISEYPKVHYLHADIETLTRSDILDDLRLGKYDVVVGINLLREGLDLPEVSLVAILDADKEGFLRSTTSLIQTMGRAARHIKGSVIMYADSLTRSMKQAIAEIDRRRKVQVAYNKKHHLVPKKISKPIREKLIVRQEEEADKFLEVLDNRKRIEYRKLLDVDEEWMTPDDKKRFIKRLTREMRKAADDLNFELATEIRDKIWKLKSSG